MIICIGGMPGSGKTTIAKKLAAKYNIECIVQTDVLKALFVALNVCPQLVVPSHQAWRKSGDENNLIPFFDSQRNKFSALILKMMDYFCKREVPVIFEGVHIDPQLAKRDSVVYFYLTVCESTRDHRLRTKATGMRIAEWLNSFPYICKLDQYMRDTYPAFVVENESMDKTLQMIDDVVQFKINSNAKPCAKTDESSNKAKWRRHQIQSECDCAQKISL